MLEVQGSALSFHHPAIPGCNYQYQVGSMLYEQALKTEMHGY